jgi:hypothetical protein
LTKRESNGRPLLKAETGGPNPETVLGIACIEARPTAKEPTDGSDIGGFKIADHLNLEIHMAKKERVTAEGKALEAENAELCARRGSAGESGRDRRSRCPNSGNGA